ncbi:MAG: hypothetical protein GXO56_00770 [Chloroflexi bacterium]|nr:hypothetical protein [Chloroflexota bacterium]
MDERKITIIEGPPPTFEVAMDEWVFSLVESPRPPRIAVTQVRALNGPALIERCYRAWRQREPIHLEFRGMDGLIQRVPIVAAHYSQIDDADVLRLWVMVDDPDLEVSYEFVDEDAEDGPSDDDLTDALWDMLHDTLGDVPEEDDDDAEEMEDDDQDFATGLHLDL